MAGGETGQKQNRWRSGDTARTKSMKTGSTLDSLAARILDEAKSKKDYAMDTRNLELTPAGNLSFRVKGENRTVKPTRLCMEQIGGRVGIPAKYMERMRTEAPSLLIFMARF